MIKIIADTTSVIEPEEAENLGIVLIPQIIVFGDKSYRDDNEITTEEFLAKLKGSPVLPKTAAPPPVLYTPFFEQITKDKDTAIILCPSAKVSGTFRSATVAAQDFPNTDIRVIDTSTIGPALGTLVYKAKQWADAGVDAQTIVDRINFAKKHNVIYFYVNTLEYLHKGGRIGSAQALVGSLLQVKPILIFKDGGVSPFEQQRTKRRAMARMAELVKNECPHALTSYLSIFQAEAMEDALWLRSEFSELMSLENIRITKLPPAIIVHAGPGVVAVSFFTDFPKD
ncbi:MAG: DegV family protein [Anaerolineaceae bacterium]